MQRKSYGSMINFQTRATIVVRPSRSSAGATTAATAGCYFAESVRARFAWCRNSKVWKKSACVTSAPTRFSRWEKAQVHNECDGIASAKPLYGMHIAPPPIRVACLQRTRDNTDTFAARPRNPPDEQPRRRVRSEKPADCCQTPADKCSTA